MRVKCDRLTQNSVEVVILYYSNERHPPRISAAFGAKKLKGAAFEKVPRCGAYSKKSCARFNDSFTFRYSEGTRLKYAPIQTYKRRTLVLLDQEKFRS